MTEHEHGHMDDRDFDFDASLVAARRNRAWFAERGIFAVDLVGGPGSGKTTLIERTIRELRGRLAVSVLAAAPAKGLDGDRVRAAGAPAVAVAVGSQCHLDAEMVTRGLAELQPASGSAVLIENVGNLVCPARIDLGERTKAVVLSVTEGDDKPLKYPDIFAAAAVLVINKIDLLPHVDFNVDRAVAHARAANPGIQPIWLSARSGKGLGCWCDWLRREASSARDRAA